MDIKQFAKSISGKEYGYPQFTKEEIETAKESGFVIVYGCSDDLMEFEGAICDEGSIQGGGEFWFNKNSICQENGDDGVFENWIMSLWCKGYLEEKVIPWSYETEIPHETFMIYEGGEPYCRGIVFSIDDVK